MPVDNNTCSLRDLFDGRTFTVPDYQRSYAWENSQVDDLLEDLEYLQRDKSHYAGTVVLHNVGGEQVMDERGSPLDNVHIVDGQQRLTTVVILLECIRGALVQLHGCGLTLAQATEQDFIRTRDQDDLPVYRLNLNSGANHFFRQHVIGSEPQLEGPRITAEKRLRQAKARITRYLDRELRGKDYEEATKFLRDLHRKLTNQLRFSLYEVESDAEVGIIFEAMNDRGKRLTELEKVKNYLLYASAMLQPNQLSTQVNEAWSRILRRLMAAELEDSRFEDDMLRTNWRMDFDPSPRNWKRIDSVKAKFNLRQSGSKQSALLEELTSYVGGLDQFSIPYCDMQRPTMSGAFESFEDSPVLDEVIEWSEKLRRLGSLVAFVPLLSAVRLVYPTDAGKYLETLKTCENFAFRVFTLKESRSDNGLVEIAREANKLRRDSNGFDKAMRNMRAHLYWRCSNEEYEALFRRHADRGHWYGWKGLRYLLYEYELVLANRRKVSPKIGWEALTNTSIEHILPQNIDAVSYWRDRFDRETHEQLRHDVGNLTLTHYNPELSNRPFHEKAGHTGAERSYANSAFFQEHELADVEDWTPEAIVDRRERLLTWARERWAVDLSDVSTEAEYPEPEDEDDETDELDELDDYDDEM